jgi:hypothetical protein
MDNQELRKSAQDDASRALVLVTSEDDAEAREASFRDTCARSMAGFVTQLIACRRRLPGYRARRTEDPREASRLYDATERRPAPARRAFERLY